MSDFNALDLDSLDALLDAAEIEAVSIEDEADEQTTDEDADPWAAAMAEQAEAETGDGDQLSEEDISTPTVPEDTEVKALTQTETPEIDLPVTEMPKPTAAPVLESVTPKPEPPTTQPTVAPLKATEEEEYRPKRIKAKNNEPEEWTEAEMESLKKLIIIFGSVIIVLVLSAIGVGVGGIMSSGQTDPKLMETVEQIKNDVGQSYLVIEDGNKQIKTISSQLSDASTQLAEMAEMMDQLKAPPPPPPVSSKSSKPEKGMTAAERKAAQREQAQQREAEGEAEESEQGEANEPKPEKSEKLANAAQVKAIAVDINDVKKRLVATQKLLEQIQKQSESMQQQSVVLTDSVKAVETELKAKKVVKPMVTSGVQKAVPEDKQAQAKPLTPPVAPPVKPADDPQYRARWSQQMGRSEGFP